MISRLENKKAVVFDVDHTLTFCNSWQLLTEALGINPDDHEDLRRKVSLGYLSKSEVKEEVLRMRRATGLATRERIRGLFHPSQLRPGAIETVQYLSERYKVTLISGSFEDYVGQVANALGVDQWYSNAHFGWNKAGLMAHELYTRQQDRVKEIHLEMFMRENGLSAVDCVAVGDGENDRRLFEIVQGIMIGENPAISNLAYTSISCLADLTQLL